MSLSLPSRKLPVRCGRDVSTTTGWSSPVRALNSRETNPEQTVEKVLKLWHGSRSRSSSVVWCPSGYVSSCAESRRRKGQNPWHHDKTQWTTLAGYWKRLAPNHRKNHSSHHVLPMRGEPCHSPRPERRRQLVESNLGRRTAGRAIASRKDVILQQSQLKS